MSESFNSRVFGSVILRSINSNFNADFTSHPRTLPDGVVYSTDKALKYSIKDYLRKNYPDEKYMFVRTYNENLNPRTLEESYEALFGEFPVADKKSKKKDKEEFLRKEILRNLYKCIDIRLFGATFATGANLSVHGVVQINHGVNKFVANDIYTEDILSPFRNPSGEGSDEKERATIGNQTNLHEGHYVFHFSLNPKNSAQDYEIINSLDDNEKLFLAASDITKLKESLNRSVTYLDTSRKVGTENEATLWVQLKEDSRLVLPSFTELISVAQDRTIDFSLASGVFNSIIEEVEIIELYYNPAYTKIAGINKSDKVKFLNILNGKEF